MKPPHLAKTPQEGFCEGLQRCSKRRRPHARIERNSIPLFTLSGKRSNSEAEDRQSTWIVAFCSLSSINTKDVHRHPDLEEEKVHRRRSLPGRVGRVLVSLRERGCSEGRVGYGGREWLYGRKDWELKRIGSGEKERESAGGVAVEKLGWTLVWGMWWEEWSSL